MFERFRFVQQGAFPPFLPPMAMAKLRIAHLLPSIALSLFRINRTQETMENCKRKFLSMLLIGALSCCSPLVAQHNDVDATAIREIFDEALAQGEAYPNLRELTQTIGGRLSGSPQAAAAVTWSRQLMEHYGFDTVFLQPVMVPHWIRGEQEKAKIVNSRFIGTESLTVCALGNSVGTGAEGVGAQVVEVGSFEALAALGREQVAGKIVFFNRPMDAKLINTFQAYGSAVRQRAAGPSEAAKYGAVGAIVRSVTTALDDNPHTGSLVYALGVPKIPAVAISTLDAEMLSKELKRDPELTVYFETHCQMLPDAPSFNVVGEIKGTRYPDQLITVGGHLDSWDTGEGAHDDGAGCVQAIEVLRIFKALDIKPNRTLRAVMFMNEENGLRGGRKYAELAQKLKEQHYAAIESDAGGFSPQGFSIDADAATVGHMQKWLPLFAPYHIHEMAKGGGGADIGPLRAQGVTLIGLRPDPQRYFDYHHTAIDTFDKVNERELHMGAAAMASLVYLIDRYGLGD